MSDPVKVTYYRSADTLFPSVANLPVVPELPDLMTFHDGARFEVPEFWPTVRDVRLKQILHYQYGALPGITMPGVRGSELSRQPSNAAEGATEYELRLDIGPNAEVTTPLFLTLPPETFPGSEGVFPVIIVGDLGWGRVKPEIREAVAKRGYALAEFSREAIASDTPERDGVYKLYPAYEGGRIAAWAWGYHRVVDYLRTRPDIDRAGVIVTGHSRGGKTCLLAGATDTRIALTAPNNSGCGGAGCFRVQGEGSERIKNILGYFPYWFHKRFADFIDNEERLPFDQHTLKACVAPRALLTTEALGDLWANPSGTQVTHLAAKPVFDLLGAEDKIGIWFREGGHEHNLADWTALLDFADSRLMGLPVETRFDQLAF